MRIIEMIDRLRIQDLLKDSALIIILNVLVLNFFWGRPVGNYYYEQIGALILLMIVAFWHVWRRIPASLYFLYALIINLVFAGMLIPCMW
jgi:hypothetical protein